MQLVPCFEGGPSAKNAKNASGPLNPQTKPAFLGDLATAIGKDPAFVARMLRLTLLAPEIVHAILAGTLQKSIPMEKLCKEMPVRWEDQKKLFGIE